MKSLNEKSGSVCVAAFEQTGFRRSLYLLATVLLSFAGWQAEAQVWSNTISGTNPNGNNPLTAGQVVAPNLTVTGIGRGPGISSNNQNDEYRATNWGVSPGPGGSTFDPDDYFYFGLNPAALYKINYASLVYHSNTTGSGPTQFAVRWSRDNYTANLTGTVVANGTSTIDLSSLMFQNVTVNDTFRIYAWGATSISGAFAIEDFIFNGEVVHYPAYRPAAGNTYYPTIQLAINASGAGETIRVDASRNYEDLIINHNLTFEGVEANIAGTASRPSGESILNTPLNNNNIINLSGAVSAAFNGFEFRTRNLASVGGAGQSLTISHSIAKLSFGDGSNNLAFNANALTLTNNHFRAINNASTNTLGNSSHIFIYEGSLNATGNKFSSGDAYTALAGATTSLPVWINLTSNANNLNINSNVFDSVDIGVLIAASASNISITNNDFSQAKRRSPGGVNGYGAGIALFQNLTPSGAIVIKNNRFVNSETGIRTSSGEPSNNFPPIELLNIAYNSFANMSENAVRIGSSYNSSTNKLNLKCNWFNDVTGPIIATPGLNNGSIGSEIIDGGNKALYKNWLMYGNDANPSIPGFQLPTTITVAPGANVSQAENHYRILSNAIGCAVSGQTIDLAGSFDLGNATAQAEWAKGNNGVSGDGQGILNDVGDDYGITAPDSSENVTITSSTTASVAGPGDLPGVNLEAWMLFNSKAASSSFRNWTISNLNITGFDLSIAGNHAGGPVTAFSGFKILNNQITVPADVNTSVNAIDANQNIGIHLCYGKNQEVTGNTITMDGSGTSNGTNYSTSVGLQSATSGGDAYDGLKINNNTISVTGDPTLATAPVIRGIWENSASTTAAIELKGNTFSNADPLNLANDNRQFAFWVTSKSSATKNVVYQNNEISGFNSGISWIGGPFTSYTAPNYNTGELPVQILNNKFDKVAEGVTVRKGGGSTNTGSPALVNENSFTNLVAGGKAINNTGTGTTNAECNWFATLSNVSLATMFSGSVDYDPILNNGTDNNPSTGFQPVPASCVPVPAKFYVNDNATTGDVYTTAVGNNANLGTSAAPFATVNYAISMASAGDTILVDAGMYHEDVVVTKKLKIHGTNAAVSPNGGTRLAESIIVPLTSEPDPSQAASAAIIYLAGAADSSVIAGFTIDGNNPDSTGGLVNNGVDIDATEGIAGYDGLAGVQIRNNIIRNTSYSGIDLYNYSTGGAPTSGNIVADNAFDNILNASGFGIGVLIYNNCYTDITNNVMTRVRVGIQTGNYSQADPANSHSITNNQIQAERRGIYYNLSYSNAAGFNISNNKITRYGALPIQDGIMVSSMTAPSGTINGNYIDGSTYGIALWNSPGAGTISNDTIVNAVVGVYATNWYGPNNANSSANNAYAVSGLNIQNASRAAIEVNDTSLNTNGTTVSVAVSGNTLMDNPSTGLLIQGGDASASFVGATPAAFANQAIYIDQISNGTNVPSANIDATAVSFDGSTGAVKPLANNFAVEDRIVHKIDNSALGLVTFKANNNFVTTNSFSIPNTTPAVQRGVDAAAATWTVNVADGTYNGVLNVNKALTVEGQSIAAILRGPYLTGNPGVNASVFMSSSNSTLRNVTVTRDYQDWYGSTTDQGITIGQATTGVRIDSVLVTANRNGIYVINAQNVTITNSTIEENRTGIHFVANVSGATVTNNYIRNNFTAGVLFNYDTNPGVTATNVSVNNNSITGNWFGNVNFQKNTGTYPVGSTAGLNFNCNWLGTASPTLNAVAAGEPGYAGQQPSQLGGSNPNSLANPYLVGTQAALIPYSPFLNAGGDANLSMAGFQPSAICVAPPSKIYVNNNSTADNDRYTSAVGNDLNDGSASAPLATITHALDVAKSGDSIYVDAGTFVGKLNVGKSLKIFGANAGTAGNSARTYGEAVVMTESVGLSASIITLGTTDSVTIDGLTINGDNPSLTSGEVFAGADIDAGYAINATENVSNHTIINNIIKNTGVMGISFANGSGTATTNNLIANNRFSNILRSNGVGVYLYNNAYTTVIDNVMDSVRIGVQTGNFYRADAGNSHRIGRNSFRTQAIGVWTNLHYSNAATFVVDTNTVSNYPGIVGQSHGLRVQSIQQTVGVQLNGNNVNGNLYGITLMNCPTSNTITVNGGTITGSTLGVFATNGINASNNSAAASTYALNDVSIVNSLVAGIQVTDTSITASPVTVGLAIGGNTTITGGPTGLIVHGGNASASFAGTGVAFNGQPVYINQVTNGSTLPSTDINATNVSFDGTTGASNSLVQNFGVEDKIVHKIDNSALGFVTVKSANAFVTTNSFATPNTTASVQRGVDAASAAWTVNVADGIYNGDVDVNKTLTVLGQSQSAVLRGLYNNNIPSVAMNAAGSIIRNVTVTRDYGVDDAAWKASPKFFGLSINANNVTADSVRVTGNRNGIYIYDRQGFTITNSIIDSNRTGFHMGVNVSNGSIRNNFIRNNYTHGVLFNFDFGQIAATNTQVNNNDISGNWYSQVSFQRGGATPASNAMGDLTGLNFNCNWLGTASPVVNATATTEPGYGAQTVGQFGGADPMLSNNALKGIEAARIPYSPFLASNGDANMAMAGFQPSAICVTPPSKLYVNNNNTADNDRYTSAVGNDLNDGSAAAPFATIRHALDVAKNTDTIYIDAGTFATTGDTITKSVKMYGANAGIAGSATRTYGESVILANGNLGNLITLAASNVKIDGLTFDGDDPISVNPLRAPFATGTDANASIAIRTMGSVNTDTIVNNIIKHVEIGFRGENASLNNLISANWFDAVGHFDYGYGVSIRNNFYADITNNKMTRVFSGVHTNFFQTAIGPSQWLFRGNDISSYSIGLAYWLNYNNATGMTIDSNSFTSEANAVNNNFGVLVVSLQDAVNATFTRNTMTNNDHGVGVYAATTTNNFTLGSTNTITGAKQNGIFITNNLNFNPLTTTNFIVSGPGGAATVKISGISLSTAASANGIKVDGTGGTTQTINVDAATALNGGTNGLVMDSTVAITGNSLNNLSFVGQSGNYIALSKSALQNQQIAATSSTFDGTTGAAKSLAQNFANEDKIVHRIDNGSLGFVLVKAANDFVTPNSFIAPATASANAQRGIDAAATGWTVNVANGTYNADVTVNKTLTVLGESQAAVLRGLYSGSADAVNVSAAGAVIRNVTVTRDYGNTLALWQGSPKNQGLNITANNVVVDSVKIIGNRNGLYINNRQGTIVRNSTIDSNRTGVQLGNDVSNTTFTNNFIRNNFTHGLLFNMDLSGTPVGTNLIVNNNVIAGNWFAQVNFANNVGKVLGDMSGMNFNCNWYGSAEPTITATATNEPGYATQEPAQFGGTDTTSPDRYLAGISAGIIPYAPFLNNGVDGNTGVAGFQLDPVDQCIDRVHNLTQNSYYHTFTAAIAAANVNDVIEGLADTYKERVVITKPLTIQGDLSKPKTTIILDGTGLAGTGSGITVANNVHNVIIRNLTVRNYAGITPNNSAGIYAPGGNDSLTIKNVNITNNSNAAGFYANGPINKVLIDSANVTGNISTTGTRGIVIWNGFKQNITITNSSVSNNNCCGIELQDGSASGVRISKNTIAGVDNAIGVVGLTGGAGANVIDSNTITITGGRFGIEVKNPNGTGNDNDTENGAIIVRGNTVTLLSTTENRDLAGIAVFRRGWSAGNADVPTGVIVKGNTVTGFAAPNTATGKGFGIVVEGHRHQVLNNTLSGNNIDIQRQSGNLPYVMNTNTDGDQSAKNDDFFGRGNSPEACNIVVTGNTPNVVTDVFYNGEGIVKNVNSGQYNCLINRAITAATAGDSLILAAPGTYNEYVLANKSIIINGMDTATRIVTSTSTLGVGATPALFKVSASNVKLMNMKMLADFSYTVSAVATSGNASNLQVTGNGIEARRSTVAYAGAYGLRNAISVNTATTGATPVGGGFTGLVVHSNNVYGNDTGVISRGAQFRAGVAADGVSGTIGGSGMGNTIQTINHDVLARFNSAGAINVTHNTFKGGGVEMAEHNGGSGTLTVANNTFNYNFNLASTFALLRLKNNNQNIATAINTNTFNGHNWYVSLENYRNVTFDGNTMTPTQKAGTTDFRLVTVNTKTINSSNVANIPVSATFTNNTFNGAGGFTTGTAMSFYNHDTAGTAYGDFIVGTLGNENTFNTSIPRLFYVDSSNNRAANTMPGFPEYGGTFATGTGYWKKDIDARNNRIDIGAGANLVSGYNAGQLATLESNFVYDYNDWYVLGDVFFKYQVHNYTQNKHYNKIQAAIDSAAASDSLGVDPGIYTEVLTINKPLVLDGPNRAVTGCGARASEAIIRPDADYSQNAAGKLVNITASNVKFRGFTLDGANAELTTGGTVINGVTTFGRRGINAEPPAVVTNTVVDNNIIRNFFRTGINLDAVFLTGASNNFVRGNRIDNIPNSYGVLLGNNFYAEVSNNCIERTYYGVNVYNFGMPNNAGAPVEVKNNNIRAYGFGVWVNNIFSSGNTPASRTINIANNTIDSSNYANWSVPSVTLPVARGFSGIFVSSVQVNSPVTLNSNTISNATRGVALWNNPSVPSVTISGLNVNNADTGIVATNSDALFGFGAGGSSVYMAEGLSLTNNKIGIVMQDKLATAPVVQSAINIQGTTSTISGTPIGVYVLGKNAGASLANININLPATGAATGVLIPAQVPGVAANPTFGSGAAMAINLNGNVNAQAINMGANTVWTVTGNSTLPDSITGGMHTFVDGAFAFNNGILNTGNGKIILGNNAADLSQSEKTTSYVQGHVQMAARSVGTAAFEFLGVKIPAGADLGTMNLARHTDPASITSIATPNQNSIQMKWDINSSTTNGRNAVQFRYLTTLANGNLPDSIRAYRYNTGSMVWEDKSGPMLAVASGASHYETPGFNVSNFSSWTLSTKKPGTPDLLLTSSLTSNNFNYNNPPTVASQSRHLVLNVIEVGGNATDNAAAPVQVRIAKSDNFTYTFDPTATTATVAAPSNVVHNGDWTMADDGFNITFTLKPGVNIDAGGVKRIRVVLQPIMNASLGADNFTSTIVGGSGLDQNSSNNLTYRPLTIN